MSIPVWITAEGGLGNYVVTQNITSTPIKLLAEGATSFNIISGTLPTGLSLNTATGSITGTFSTLLETTVYEFIVRASNANQENDDRRFSILVAANNYPSWITESGSVGGYTELSVLPTITLECANPLSGSLEFSIISGSLPSGITLQTVTSTTCTITGTLPPLATDQIYEFTVRAKNTHGVTDRTFSLTVKGISLPYFELPENAVIAIRDSRELKNSSGDLDYQIVVNDSTPGSTPVFTLLSGKLPPNVTLTADGKLTGVIIPTAAFGSDALEGWDVAPNDKYGWDLDTKTNEISYPISVLFDNGTSTTVRKLIIFVMPYYNTLAFIPNVNLTNPQPSPLPAKRNPLILTRAGNIGNYRHDNFFLYKFDSIDFDNEAIEFQLVSGSFPAGLTFNTATGWLYGQLPYQFSRDQSYSFSLRVRKVGATSVTSDTRSYSLNILGESYSTFEWISSSDLGTVTCGVPITLRIQGTPAYKTVLKYEVVSGELPSGLQLQIDGTLVGRPSFNQPNYSKTYNFTVGVTDYRSTIDIQKSFTLTVNDIRKKPYENLYIKAFMPIEDRQAYQDFIKDYSIFDVDSLYRPNDTNFGISKDVRFLFAYGLDPVKDSKYTLAMRQNFFDKRIHFGDVKTARAVKDGNVLYEVIYVEINESSDPSATTSQLVNFSNTTMVKLKSEMINRLITSDNEILTVNTTDFTADITKEYQIYPNDFNAMQESIQEEIGNYDYDTIPLWMSSKQEDGTILGFTYAAVIAYVKPGNAKRIKLRIDRSGFDFKQLNFVADRFIWDNNMSAVWNLNTSAYIDNGITQTDYTDPDTNDKYLIFPRQGLYRT